MSPAQRSTAASGLGSALPHTSKAIYLDYNGTTPIFPEVCSCSCSRVREQVSLPSATLSADLCNVTQVAEAMKPYLGECFGNPSSGHIYGRRVRSNCVHPTG